MKQFSKLRNSYLNVTPAGKKEHLCDCNKAFHSKIELISHRKKVHDNVVNRSSCELCNKSFADKPTLKRHISEVHDKETYQKCDFCNKILAATSSMERHVKFFHKNLVS